jgi:hypothetical protein
MFLRLLLNGCNLLTFQQNHYFLSPIKIPLLFKNLSVETFDAIHYSGMVLFKIGILLFNLVPYFALRIVG